MKRAIHCAKCGEALSPADDRCDACGAMTPRVVARIKRAVILFLITAPLMAGLALWYFHTIDNIGR